MDMTTKINQRVTENKVESNIKECRYVDCSKFKSCFSKFDGISALHLNISSLSKHIDSFPVSTQRRFDVYTTLKRRHMDVKTTLCAYWVK